MYEILDDSRNHSVDIDSLSRDEEKELKNARRALQSDSRPARYGCRQEGDAWQIQIPCGGRKMLLGYEIYEKRKLIFLNYLKWDESSAEIETVGWFRRFVYP